MHLVSDPTHLLSDRDNSTICRQPNRLHTHTGQIVTVMMMMMGMAMTIMMRMGGQGRCKKWDKNVPKILTFANKKVYPCHKKTKGCQAIFSQFFKCVGWSIGCEPFSKFLWI